MPDRAAPPFCNSGSSCGRRTPARAPAKFPPVRRSCPHAYPAAASPTASPWSTKQDGQWKSEHRSGCKAPCAFLFAGWSCSLGVIPGLSPVPALGKPFLCCPWRLPPRWSRTARRIRPPRPPDERRLDPLASFGDLLVVDEATGVCGHVDARGTGDRLLRLTESESVDCERQVRSSDETPSTPRMIVAHRRAYQPTSHRSWLSHGRAPHEPGRAGQSLGRQRIQPAPSSNRTILGPELVRPRHHGARLRRFLEHAPLRCHCAARLRGGDPLAPVEPADAGQGA